MRRDVVLIPLYLWVSASIVLHLLSFLGTTEVAARVQRAREQARRLRAVTEPPFDSSQTEVQFEYLPPAVPSTSSPDVPPPVVRSPSTERHRTERQQLERTVRTVPVVPSRPEVPSPQASPPPPVIATTPPPRPPSLRNMQHVDQQTRDNQPPPDDPAFLAQSNNNVREQTIAAVRNLQRDDAHPQVGGSPAQNRGDRLGNGDRDVSADDRDQDGDPRRVPVTSPTLPSAQRQSVSTLPRHGQSVANRTVEVEGARHPQPENRHVTDTGERGAAHSGRPATASGTVPVMVAPDGSGGTLAAGSTPAAPGRQGTSETDNGQHPRTGHSGSAADRLGVRGLGAAGVLEALSPNASTYAQVYGQEAEQERSMARLRRSQARGDYADSWRVNRAAIENYTPTVRVGNQTALRTAASPFSAYLTAMHRRIHRIFADGFLAGLDNQPADSPLNDRSLVTTLEIVLERDGTIARLGVVRTSGNTAFDVASLNSVRRAAPFGTAPAAILSGDGRVYIHWGFYRNERQCGTFNAEPFILPAPGEHSPSPPASPPSSPGSLPSDERPARPAPDVLGSDDPGGAARRSMAVVR